MKDHLKHPSIKRRKNEFFAPNELAILGAKCDIISDFCQKIAEKLKKTAKIAYLDASHDDGKKPLNLDQFIHHKIGVQNGETGLLSNPYQQHIQFSKYDLLLINGNHFQGAQQILILDPKKEESIKKRIAQISAVQMVIKFDKDQAIFPCVLEKFPNLHKIPCFEINDIEGICRVIDHFIKDRIPVLNGLVLAGGKSMRMGKDKTQLTYHNKPQLDHLVEMLESLDLPTYISISKTDPDQKGKFIIDQFKDLGPFGAICSAFKFNPNLAWLTVASDLPFLQHDLIQELVAKRNPSKVATAIKGKSKEFVEPLITIYEPKAYPILLSFLSQGYACPRKMLINSDVEIVEVDDQLIRNINTPDQYQAALKEIKNS